MKIQRRCFKFRRIVQGGLWIDLKFSIIMYDNESQASNFYFNKNSISGNLKNWLINQLSSCLIN